MQFFSTHILVSFKRFVAFNTSIFIHPVVNFDRTGVLTSNPMCFVDIAANVNSYLHHFVLLLIATFFILNSCSKYSIFEFSFKVWLSFFLLFSLNCLLSQRIASSCSSADFAKLVPWTTFVPPSCLFSYCLERKDDV